MSGSPRPQETALTPQPTQAASPPSSSELSPAVNSPPPAADVSPVFGVVSTEKIESDAAHTKATTTEQADRSPQDSKGNMSPAENALLALELPPSIEPAVKLTFEMYAPSPDGADDAYLTSSNAIEMIRDFKLADGLDENSCLQAIMLGKDAVSWPQFTHGLAKISSLHGKKIAQFALYKLLRQVTKVSAAVELRKTAKHPEVEAVWESVPEELWKNWCTGVLKSKPFQASISRALNSAGWFPKRINQDGLDSALQVSSTCCRLTAGKPFTQESLQILLIYCSQRKGDGSQTFPPDAESLRCLLQDAGILQGVSTSAKQDTQATAEHTNTSALEPSDANQYLPSPRSDNKSAAVSPGRRGSLSPMNIHVSRRMSLVPGTGAGPSSPDRSSVSPIRRRSMAAIEIPSALLQARATYILPALQEDVELTIHDLTKDIDEDQLKELALLGRDKAMESLKELYAKKQGVLSAETDRVYKEVVEQEKERAEEISRKEKDDYAAFKHSKSLRDKFRALDTIKKGLEKGDNAYTPQEVEKLVKEALKQEQLERNTFNGRIKAQHQTVRNKDKLAFEKRRAQAILRLSNLKQLMEECMKRDFSKLKSKLDLTERTALSARIGSVGGSRRGSVMGDGSTVLSKASENNPLDTQRKMGALAKVAGKIIEMRRGSVIPKAARSQAKPSNEDNENVQLPRHRKPSLAEATRAIMSINAMKRTGSNGISSSKKRAESHADNEGPKLAGTCDTLLAQPDGLTSDFTSGAASKETRAGRPVSAQSNAGGAKKSVPTKRSVRPSTAKASSRKRNASPDAKPRNARREGETADEYMRRMKPWRYLSPKKSERNTAENDDTIITLRPDNANSGDNVDGKAKTAQKRQGPAKRLAQNLGTNQKQWNLSADDNEVIQGISTPAQWEEIARLQRDWIATCASVARMLATYDRS